MVAVAIGGAAVLGAGASIVAGNKAAKAETKAADQANDTQRYMYDTTRDDFAPWREMGIGALQQLGTALGVTPAKSLVPTGTTGGTAGGSTGGGATGGAPAPAQTFTQEDVPGAKDAAFQFLMSQIGPKRTKKINAFQGDADAKLNYALSEAHSGERKAYQQYLAEHPLTRQVAVPQAPATPTTPATGTGTGTGTTPEPGSDQANPAYGGFFASPGYNFRLNEGIKAVEHSNAARGLLHSGAAVKAVQRYGEGLAASEYDAYAARLAQLAGFGQSATSSTAAAGSSAANNISANLIASGNARASSYANIGSSINSGLNNIMTAYLMKGSFGGGGSGGGLHPMGGI